MWSELMVHEGEAVDRCWYSVYTMWRNRTAPIPRPKPYSYMSRCVYPRWKACCSSIIRILIDPNILLGYPCIFPSAYPEQRPRTDSIALISAEKLNTYSSSSLAEMISADLNFLLLRFFSLPASLTLFLFTLFSCTDSSTSSTSSLGS